MQMIKNGGENMTNKFQKSKPNKYVQKECFWSDIVWLHLAACHVATDTAVQFSKQVVRVKAPAVSEHRAKSNHSQSDLLVDGCEFRGLWGITIRHRWCAS